MQVHMVPESKQSSLEWLLQDGSPSLPAFAVPRLLRIQSAAKYLSATTWQIETLLRQKTIPSFVLGKRRVVDRLELDRYVERRNAAARGERADIGHPESHICS
jgi:excisionase family DNA binding protein